MKTYYSPQTAADVTNEIIEMAFEITEGWYSDTRIDWEDVWGRLDGSELDDGTILDLGTNLLSPALSKIKAEIREIRKRG